MGLTAEDEAKLAKLNEAIKLKPRDGVSYARMGHLLDKSGDPRSAINVMRFAIQISPRTAARYDELGHVFRRAALSVEAHTRNIGQTPPPEPAKRMPGDEDPCWRRKQPECFPLQYYTQTQLYIAEEDFLRRVEKDSNDAKGFQLLAQLYRNYSVTACTTALQLQPTRPTAYLTLARVLSKGGSVGLYRRAMSLLPAQSELRCELGAVLVELRYYAQANNEYRKAIALAPERREAYEALGELRLLRNRSAEAVDVAARVLRLLPDAPVALADYADRLSGNDVHEATAKVDGRHVRRAAAPQSALARAAKSPSAVGIAAAIGIMSEGRCEQRRFAEAAALGRAAVTIWPNASRGYMQLGRALNELHEMDAAAASRGAHGESAGEGGSARPWWRVTSYDADGTAARARRRRERLRDDAIAACEEAAKLAPADAPNRFRLGTMLRRVPGRLQESIQHFNGCILANELFPGVVEAQREAVAALAEIRSPKVTWRDTASNGIAVLFFLGALSHFFVS